MQSLDGVTDRFRRVASLRSCAARDRARDWARQLTSRFVATGFVLAVVACGGAAPEEAPPVRELPTADPFARGYEREDFPRVTEIAPGVFTWEQLRSAGDEWFTTVSLYVVADDRVLVADGQGNATETQRLLDHIEQTHGLPVTDLVIGSDHGDHTGGNEVFDEGIRIYAHPRSDAALRAAGLPGATDLVDEQMTLDFGSRPIELRYLGPAHTGGDLVVQLPDDGVLFMSEAYLHRVFPAMRSACPSGWITMLERAQALEPAIPVPGHGFIDAPEVLVDELDVFRQAVEAVVAEGRRLHDLGLSIDDAIAQADFGEYGDWSLVTSQGPTALRQIYAELAGELDCPMVP
jgi:cyclase